MLFPLSIVPPKSFHQTKTCFQVIFNIRKELSMFYKQQPSLWHFITIIIFFIPAEKNHNGIYSLKMCYFLRQFFRFVKKQILKSVHSL